MRWIFHKILHDDISCLYKFRWINYEILPTKFHLKYPIFFLVLCTTVLVINQVFALFDPSNYNTYYCNTVIFVVKGGDHYYHYASYDIVMISDSFKKTLWVISYQYQDDRNQKSNYNIIIKHMMLIYFCGIFYIFLFFIALSTARSITVSR